MDKVTSEERQSWAELSRRMDFFIELNCGSVNKELAKDAGTAFTAAAEKYFDAHAQRMEAEFGSRP